MAIKMRYDFITKGDFLDLYYKIRFKGIRFIILKLSKLSYKNRVSSKWNWNGFASDFWIIPQIRENWNVRISGKPFVSYEEYVCSKYLKDKMGLNLLSIGCGEGNHERNFTAFAYFEKIIGVDVSSVCINKARQIAEENSIDIEYYCEDFLKMKWDTKFKVILFDSSLHHFNNIDSFLQKYINPILCDDGIVVVFEYCGPNRLAWNKAQLLETNRLLNLLPQKFKFLIDGKSIKRKNYRPGLLRMLIVDPSEAPDSENLVKALHNNFKIVEEKQLGWTISHLLFKSIAHNFLNDDREAKELLDFVLKNEKKYEERSNDNNAIFGVYKKTI
jgi:2-polyprenyl-3-methyl-5-hydroxy-6-metoxy-1,4-benzoquinol methylase